jgi:hypothetical protein
LSIRAPGKRTPLPYEIRSLGYPAAYDLRGTTQRGPRSQRGAGNPLITIKFSSVLPIIVLGKSPGSGGNTLLIRRQRKKYLPWRKQIGGNDVEMRSPLRMESPPRSLHDPSRGCGRESPPGKGSRRARLPGTAISSSRNGCSWGIANRPHVIREQRLNIKIVYGNRHFPVDTENAIF